MRVVAGGLPGGGGGVVEAGREKWVGDMGAWIGGQLLAWRFREL
jgi:hypothetical protein